ncbi:RfaG Glycosyltransferase [Candidatus Nanopelagicaceae bacterium]
MNHKKVVFVLNSTSGGGAEVSAMTTYRQLKSLGYDIQVIAINQNEFMLGEKSELTIELGRHWRSGFRETLMAYFRFRKIMKEMKPRAVVAHCELPELFCAFLPTFPTRLYAVEHTSNPWAGRKTMGRFIRGILKYRKIEWLTVDRAQNEIWFGDAKPTYIPNPTSKNQIFERQDISQRIAFVGRLSEEKRTDWAINAAIKSSLAIGVIGDGQCKTSLMEKYFDHKDLVFFYGFMDNPWSRLSTDTLIVMPSKYEGDGLVAVEAIINGFPIILADNEDLRRFELPEENYFSSENELVELINRVKDQGVDSFRIPLATITKIQKERDIEANAIKWVQVLNLEETHV